MAVSRVIVPHQQSSRATPERAGGGAGPDESPRPDQVPDSAIPSAIPSPKARTYPPDLPDEDYLDHIENTKRSGREIRRTDRIFVGLTALIVLLLLLAAIVLWHHSHISS